MKFLILGSGYVGTYLSKYLTNAVLLTEYVKNPKQLENLLLNEFPSHTLINCAGKTGRPNVDWCEDNKDLTFDCNVTLPVMIAEVCKKLKSPWIHIGSGCVYDGYDKEYDEDDEPNFNGSFYSASKVWSQKILEDYDEVLVLRVRMPIDEFMHKRCYISKIVKYAKEGRSLFDLLNSMTMLWTLGEAIEHLAEHGHTGVWNIVNSGATKISEILELYGEFVQPITWTIDTKENVEKNMIAKRSNCVLSNDKLRESGFPVTDVRYEIGRMLKAYGQRKGN